jgi:hypothetical protein
MPFVVCVRTSHSFILEVLAATVEKFLFAFSSYVIGMTSALVGTFIALFIHSFGYDFRTQYKWAVLLGNVR